MCAIITLLLLLLAHRECQALAVEACPQGCSCTRCPLDWSFSNGTSMNCSLEGLKSLQKMAHVDNICILNLTALGLTDIPQGNFSKLSKMFLSHNNIGEAPKNTFSGFTDLETLDLDYNNIEKLMPGSFAGLTKLIRLVLDHNKLKHLASGTFKGLIALRYLGLRYNRLVSWEGTFYEEMPNLIQLDITGNDNFLFDLMALPTGKVALEKIYGLKKISKKCKACSDLTRANVSRKIVLPQRACQYTPTQYLPMVDEYQARGVLLKGTCGTKQCDLMLTDVDPLRKIYKDKCWAAIRQIRGIEYTIGVVAIFVNLTVIAVILANKILRGKVSFLLVCHLAFCDLLMGCFSIMIATGHGIDHDPSFRRWRAEVCPYYRTVFVFSQTMGAATSTLVTLERYMAIVHAMNPSLRVTQTVAAIFLTCSWIFTAIMATLIQEIDKQWVRDNAMCILAQNLTNLVGKTNQKILYTHGLMISLVFLYMVVIGLYIHLYVVVKKAAENAGVRREGKLAKRIGLIVMSNLLFFVVPNSIIVVFTTTTAVDFSRVHPILNSMVKMWLPPVCMGLNACLNPFLFAFRNEMFMNALKASLSCRRPQVSPVTHIQLKTTNASHTDTSVSMKRSGSPSASMATNRTQVS